MDQCPEQPPPKRDLGSRPAGFPTAVPFGVRGSRYVRTSRVGGRVGESYLSPTVQRNKIAGWAKLHDVTLGQVVVEEDVSGAKPVGRARELGALLKRVESGESAGIVTFKLSRFGRGALETLQAVDRIRRAGGRLVTVKGWSRSRQSVAGDYS